MQFNISAIDQGLRKALQDKIDQKTKPLGSLGQLEGLALKIGLIQNTLSPVLSQPNIIIFAGDHGIVGEGVSAYPQEVTYQMVLNFLEKGAAINVFSQQHGLRLRVVDAGVNFDFDFHPDLVRAKIKYGTDNFIAAPAMSREDCEKAISKGADIVQGICESGCNVIGFGEMGIGNTSSASLIMSLLCGLPVHQCVGAGTGLDEGQVRHKVAVLERALAFHHLDAKDAIDVLATFGGFEMAMMCGGMLQAAVSRTIVMVDGFIASAVFMVAERLCPGIRDYAVFCHQSEEKGHQKMLDYLKAEPLLRLGMRLGEGTGCAVAYPILESAIGFLNRMASFEEAGVSSE